VQLLAIALLSPTASSFNSKTPLGLRDLNGALLTFHRSSLSSLALRRNIKFPCKVRGYSIFGVHGIRSLCTSNVWRTKTCIEGKRQME